MKIVIPHFSVLPVKKYGGIERMIFWHLKELVRQGHEAILIGHPESKVEEHGIRLIPYQRDNWWTQVPKDADGIQTFYNCGEIPLDIPLIVNMGCNGQPGEKFHKNSVFVSKKHAKNHGSNTYIYNALDLEEYPYEKSTSLKWDNFFFLAKASWSVKNLKHARQACVKAKKHLHICGGRTYIPSRYLHNVGMVGGQEKLDTINKCDALIFPVRWHEPFGLAVIEAMALGRPAITSPYGSLQEIVTKDTGIICANKAELISALEKQPKNFDPNIIRKYVEDNFSISNFTKCYIELFQKLDREGGYLNETSPTWQLKLGPEELLTF